MSRTPVRPDAKQVTERLGRRSSKEASESLRHLTSLRPCSRPEAGGRGRGLIALQTCKRRCRVSSGFYSRPALVTGIAWEAQRHPAG